MDVRLDEARADESPARLSLLLRRASEAGSDGGDASVLHADVDGRQIRPAVGKARVA
jgi:hypothetical protein